MKKLVLVGMVLAALALMAGCSMTIPTTDLSGMLGGTAWDYVEGEIEESFFDSTDYSFTLVGEDVADPGWPDGDYILGSVPKSVGSYKVGLLKDASTTFYVDSVNIIATKGVIEVQEVTATTVTLGFNVKVDGDNYIEGVAELPLVTE